MNEIGTRGQEKYSMCILSTEFFGHDILVYYKVQYSGFSAFCVVTVDEAY